MASELKPWKYEIKYGPEGEDAYSWVYDDHGAMVATMKTHKAKQIVDTMNTRPAPAATETGLETKGWEVTRYDNDGRWLETSLHIVEPSITGAEPTDTEELVHRVTAEAIIAELQAKAKDYREYSERLEKRLESEEVTRSQAEELLAAERAKYRDAMEKLVESQRETLVWQQRAIDLKADNAAKDARIKELEKEVEKQTKAATTIWDNCDFYLSGGDYKAVVELDVTEEEAANPDISFGVRYYNNSIVKFTLGETNEGERVFLSNNGINAKNLVIINRDRFKALEAKLAEKDAAYERLEQQAIKDRKLRNEAQMDADLWRFSVDMDDHPSLLVKVWKQRKALEAKLAAARKALERADEALQLGATEPGHTYVKIALGEVQS